MEFTTLTHCCASGIDYHKAKPCAWKRQGRRTRIPFIVSVEQCAVGNSWQGKKSFSLGFKRGGLLVSFFCCRSQNKCQGNSCSKWSRRQMVSGGLGFSRKKQWRLLDTEIGSIKCNFQSSCSSSDQSCRQTHQCRVKNCGAMSSDYYMDNTLQKSRVPVFVMLPLDLIIFGECKQMKLRRVKSLAVALHALKLAGVDGMMVDVWWGAVECHVPCTYAWSAYEDLFHMVIEAGLKAEVIMSFHACMESPFDDKKYVGLPLWINEIGQSNSDIFYRDRRGYHSKEYLSLGIDEIPVLSGRTAVECYEDFMLSFVNTFGPILGSSIVKITVGLGPAEPIAAVLAQHGAALNFPCVEMLDSEHPDFFLCSPEGLLAQVQQVAQHMNVPLWGQNAIMRFDEAAFDRVIHKTKNQTYPMHTFTFLRLGEPLLSSRNWANFVRFVNRMCSKSNGPPRGHSGSICGGFCKLF